MRALSTTPLLICVLASLLLASAPAFAQKVYQWKDAKGVTHYSDSPPPGQQVKDRRIDHRGEPIAETPAGKIVESPQCITARQNLKLLAGSGAVQQDSDGDGKPDKALSDDDRLNQRELATAATKAYCTPVTTAGR